MKRATLIAILCTASIVYADCSDSARQATPSPERDGSAAIPIGMLDGGVPDLMTTTDAQNLSQGTQLLYVATFLGGMLAYSIDEKSGDLTPIAGSPFDGRGSLYSAAITTAGFAYAVDRDTGELFEFQQARPGGALSSLNGSPIQIGGGPLSIAVDPLEHFAYIADGNALQAFAIDAASGALAPVPGLPFATTGAVFIAVHPSGRFVYTSANGISAYAVDANSGGLLEVPGSPFAVADVRGGAIVFDAAGRFLYNGGGNLNGFTIDPSSGALTPLPGSPFPGGASGSDLQSIDIAMDPKGRFLFANRNSTGQVGVYQIDAQSGSLTTAPGSPFDVGPAPYSVAVDGTGRFLYIGNDDAAQVSAFSIDAATGALGAIAGSPFAANGLQPQLVITHLMP